MNRKIINIIIALVIILLPNVTMANEFNSTSFRVLDPVIKPGGFSSSAAFRLLSTIGELAVGTSSSALFKLGSGFLRYPSVTTPSVSASAGDAKVTLTWTQSGGSSGWSPSGYKVGQSTTSGGPYTFTSVGNVLTSARTGLTNGTTYYFVIAVEDIFGNIIATSTQVSSTPTASTPPPAGGGGGGGGGGSPGTGESTGNSGVIFSGRAYPLSKVNILKDGQIVITTIAGPDSNFSATLTNLSTGNYTFGVYGEDKNSIKSNIFTFPIYITQDVMTKIGGIFISPTISVDKSEVKKGDNIVIFGQSTPNANIVASVNSEKEYFASNKSDKDGVYLLNFDTSVLEKGQHHTKSKSVIGNEISDYSRVVEFSVGDKNVPNEVVKFKIKGDINGDNRVNLIDFSIAAFWYKKLSPPANVDVNNDKKVDLIDFSIMAFNWTG